MADYRELGLNQFLQPINAPVSNNNNVSAYEFDSTYDRGAVGNAQLLSGAINNAKVRNAYRAYNSVVSTIPGDGDTNDIQFAIDALNDTGEGGIILIRPGTYLPLTPLILYDNITLIGVDPINTIIDFSDAGNCSAGCIQIIGTSRTSTNTISVTNGDATVTGSSTTFSSSGVVAGDLILIKGAKYEVLSVASDTSLELTETYKGNTESGVFFDIWSSKSNVNLYNLTISNGSSADTSGAGVVVNYADNTDIRNCIISNHTIGIDSLRTYDFKITNNTCNNNTTNGIDLSFQTATYVKDNVCNGNTSSGIECDAGFSDHVNFILNNSCTSNGTYGIYVFVSSNYNLQGNSCVGNNSHGIFLEGSTYNILNNNICYSNGIDGINITNRISVQSEYNIVLGNNCSGNDDDGIELTSGADNNNVCHNVTQSNSGTNLVDSGLGNTVSDNT